MKKLLCSLFAVIASSSSFALPNIWNSGSGQGWYEHIITDNAGNTLNIVCNIGAEDDQDHQIHFTTKNGKEIGGQDLQFLIDGKEYTPLYMYTFTRGGSEEWYRFTKALEKSNTIVIYDNNNSKLATFKPTKESRKEVLGNFSKNCPPMGSK